MNIQTLYHSLKLGEQTQILTVHSTEVTEQTIQATITGNVEDPTVPILLIWTGKRDISQTRCCKNTYIKVFKSWYFTLQLNKDLKN